MLRPLPLMALAGALLAGCTSGGAAPAAPAAAPPPALSPVTGFRVALTSQDEPAPGTAGAGKVAWRTSWRLSWDPVPGATGYAVSYGTSEGASGAPRAVQAQTSLTVEAAAGTSTRARLEQDREAGLLLTSSQLLVAVAATGPGATGPRSLWFPVGDVPPRGVPIGTADLGHDDAG